MNTDMSLSPRIVERPEQPYLAIGGEVAMDGIPEIAHRIPDVLGRLAGHGLTPAGPPFLKYDVLYRSGRLRVEAGVAVADAGTAARVASGPGGYRAGVLLGGRFALVTHLGPPSGLLEVTAGLLDWGAEQGLAWDLTDTGDGERWGLRMELYRSDPAVVEPERWETDVVIRLAGDPGHGAAGHQGG